jgi:hypothetical protein
MRALEAYRAEEASAEEPMAIAVEARRDRAARKMSIFWRLDSQADVEAALTRGFVVFMPERPMKLLALEHESLRPLHLPWFPG